MDINPKCPKLPWMVDFHTSQDGKIFNTQLEAAFANTTLEYLSSLNIKSKPSVFRATQLMCTISTNMPCTTIEELLSVEMSVARITATSHQKIVELISKVRAVTDSYSRKVGKIYPLAIALEIKGPEIRTGNLKSPAKKIFLEKGQLTNITTNPTYEEFVTKDMIYVNYENLPSVIQPGDRVILDNGSVALSALECVESIIKCIVEKAGDLLSNASVIVPNAPLELPLVSASDQELMKIGKGENVDLLLVSGIYNRDAVLEVRELLGEDGSGILIISKIENSAAIDNIDSIIDASDGVCVDCERLMIELPKEKLFLVQKSILAKCNLAGKPGICTININNLHSISKSEVCDIANAIIDGSDGLLLPEDNCTKEGLKSISVISREAEPAIYQKQIFSELTHCVTTPAEALYSLAIAAVESALKTNAAAIVCLTSSGRTAKLLARFRPRCPIIAVTRYARIARQLRLYRCIEPLIYLRPFQGNWDKDVEERMQLGVTYGKYVGYIRMGDAVVAVSGSRPECGLPNSIQVVYASEFDTLTRKFKYETRL